MVETHFLLENLWISAILRYNGKIPIKNFIVQYHFGVNCIVYLFMLQNIFYHIKKILINTHTKILTEITDIIIVFRKKLLKFLQGDF